MSLDGRVTEQLVSYVPQVKSADAERKGDKMAERRGEYTDYHASKSRDWQELFDARIERDSPEEGDIAVDESAPDALGRPFREAPASDIAADANVARGNLNAALEEANERLAKPAEAAHPRLASPGTGKPAKGLRLDMLERNPEDYREFNEKMNDLASRDAARRKQFVDLVEAPESQDKSPSPYYQQDDVGFEPRRGESRNSFDVQGRDRFARLNDNRFLAANDNPLSTFSIDVDTASYSVIRSRIEAGQAPPPAAVRVEELINYFSYNYPQPTDDAPFAVHVDVAACPWKTSHRLVRIGLKGKEIAKADRPASNLVFLVDVSGSMQPQNKLPLVRQGLLRLVSELDERDRVAIVVYAGSSGCVLASTPCT
jgi:hypothetical protein